MRHAIVPTIVAVFMGGLAARADANCLLSGTDYVCSGDLSSGLTITTGNETSVVIQNLTANVPYIVWAVPQKSAPVTFQVTAGPYEIGNSNVDIGAISVVSNSATGSDGSGAGNGGQGGRGDTIGLPFSGRFYVAGGSSTALYLGSDGGSGGQGGSSGGKGGAGGAGGRLNLNGTGTVDVAGSASIAIEADSDGGVGGSGRAGGNGGAGGSAIVSSDAGITVEASDTGQAAVIVEANGGAGGNGEGGTNSGGHGGAGGTIGINQGTTGAWTVTANGSGNSGFSLESIGGAGGAGGRAGAGGDGGAITVYNASIAVMTTGPQAPAFLAVSAGGRGGSGGAVGPGGNGGAISLAGVWTISTAGAQSAGIAAYSTGVMAGGGAGQGGDGGQVSVTIAANSNIQTAGTQSAGVLAQSAGGNGADVSITNHGAVATTGDHSAAIEGQIIGGGLAEVDNLGAITTGGDSAEGILAKGSGGGAIDVQNGAGGSAGTVTTHGAASYAISARSIGGAVTVDQQDGTLTTSGIGSAAIFAQGIGGGSGTAGTVQVTVDGNIVTSGASADGVWAQAVGGKNRPAAVSKKEPINIPGTVAVTVDGSIAVSGAGADGIYAQSIGAGMGAVAVTIGAGGSVIGGAAAIQSGGYDGAGVFVGDGASAMIANAGTIASVGGSDGVAIRSAGAPLTITNTGTITGEVMAGTSKITLINQTAGVLNAGPEIKANVFNSGLVTLAGGGAFNQTRISGNFDQSATGLLQLNVDFASHSADMLSVGGRANLSGTLVLHAVNIMPSSPITLLAADGGVVIHDLTAASTGLFAYSLKVTGDALTVAATSLDFAMPAANLSAADQAVARGLRSVWNAGGNPVFDRLFAMLNADAQSSPARYRQALNQLSPRASVAVGAQLPVEIQDFSNALLGCRDMADATAVLGEDGCAWMRISGRSIDQDGVGGIPAFNLSSITYQIGAQTQIAPQWLASGSLAYQTSNLGTQTGDSSGHGQSGYAGVALTWQTDPWQLSFALSGAFGAMKMTRTVALAGFFGIERADPDLDAIGARVRAAYDIMLDDWHLRPRLDLDLIHAYSPAYGESGQSPIGLRFDDTTVTTVVATPAVEIGGQVELPNGRTLRPFMAVGVSLATDTDWRVPARFAGAPSGSAPFLTNVQTDTATGRLSAGLQLLDAGPVDFRIQYDGQFSTHRTSHAGFLTAALGF